MTGKLSNWLIRHQRQPDPDSAAFLHLLEHHKSLYGQKTGQALDATNVFLNQKGAKGDDLNRRLFDAISFGDPEIVQRALDRGADVNAELHASGGWRPVHQLILNDYHQDKAPVSDTNIIRILDILVAKKADLRAVARELGGLHAIEHASTAEKIKTKVVPTGLNPLELSRVAELLKMRDQAAIRAALKKHDPGLEALSRTAEQFAAEMKEKEKDGFLTHFLSRKNGKKEGPENGGGLTGL